MVTVSLNPDGGIVFATLSMVRVFWNPDGGVMFATLSMVTVSLNLDGGVVFITLLLNLSMVTAFISADGGVCIYNFVLRQKHGVQFLPPVCERFLKAVVNNSNKWDYRLTVRSIFKQRNWKQRRNREPSRELYTSCGKERSIKK